MLNSTANASAVGNISWNKTHSMPITAGLFLATSMRKSYEWASAWGLMSFLAIQSYDDEVNDLPKESKLPKPNHYIDSGQPVVVLPIQWQTLSEQGKTPSF